MKHRIKERAIHALLDRRLGDAERDRLEGHLKECEPCRAFYQRLRVTRETLSSLGAASPPPVDWARIESGIEAGVVGQRRTQSTALSTYALWGSLAAATAAAFLVTWVIASPSGREEPTDRGTSTVAEKSPPAAPGAPRPATPQEVMGFVTFLSGQSEMASPGAEWAPLSLESPLEVGTRLRTSEQASAGFQLGLHSGCRLSPSSEAQVARLGAPAVQVVLEQGQVTCTSDDRQDEPPLVLAVMDVVASASGSARFSIRQEAQVVVIELAEGTLTVSSEGSDEEQTLSEPGRFTLRRDSANQGLLVEADGEAPSLPQLPPLSRRAIASLQIPQIPGVDRVEVDDIEYGLLPLQLRHRPGLARLRLFAEGREPLLREIEVGLGPRNLEVAALDLGDFLSPEQAGLGAGRLLERRVAPRLGTYNEVQVRRLRSLVSRSVRGCYERALKRNPSIWGRIGVQFTVTTSGEARQVRVASLAGGHEDVNSCVASTLGHQQYPAPVGGHVPIEQTITLSPQF